MLLIGLDLAWGEKNSDGLCFIRYDADRRQASLLGYDYPQGDLALIAAITGRLRPDEPAFAAIDAPIVCPNLAGARPVDRLTHTLFHREHAACHPANLTKCPRPRASSRDSPPTSASPPAGAFPQSKLKIKN